MYAVSQAIKDAFELNGSVKRGYIEVVPLSSEEPLVLNESNIKDLNLLDDIYTPKEGVIGSVIAKQVDLSLFRPQDFKLEDREFDLYLGVEVNGTPEYVPYGRYIVQRPQNNVVSKKTTTIAFDYMVKFNVKYVDDGIYPKTAGTLLQSACTQAGVELATTTFINSDFIIDSNQFVNGESCREVLKAIAQLAGGFCKIGRDNKLYIKFPEQAWKEKQATGTDIEITDAKEDVGKITGFECASTQATTILPSTYTQVDYIESTGTQYINTGIKLKTTNKLELSFERIDDTEHFVFGSRISGTSQGYTVNLHRLNVYINTYSSWSGGSTVDGLDETANKKVSLGNHIIKISSNGLLIDDVSYNCNVGTIDSTLNMYLFGLNHNGTLDARRKPIRIHYCKIWDNEILVNNFIPCYRNSDNVIGMYDTVNNVFYTNAGTGTFLKGSNLVLPTPDFPISIYSTGDTGTINVWSHGKNMFDKSNASIINGYVASSILTANASMRTLIFKCESSETYTISKQATATSRFKVSYSTGATPPTINSSVTDITQNNTATNITVTTPSNATYLVVWYWYTTDTLTEAQVLNSLQIEQGNTATPYEPYTGAEYPITLPDGFVGGSLPNGVCDSVELINGEYKFIQRLGKKVLNGTETINRWATNNTSYYRWFIEVADVKVANDINEFANVFSNYLKPETEAGTYTLKEGICVRTSDYHAFVLYMDKTKEMTSVEFKTWLASNPIEVVYELATPIIHDINVENLETYKDYTKISSTNKIKPELDIEYNALLPVETFNKSNYTNQTSINTLYGPVNRLILRMSQVEGENVVLEDTDSIAQNGLKELTISDNPLLYTQEKRQSVIEAIWNKVKGFKYVAFNAKARSKPYLDTGDLIKIEDMDGNPNDTFLFTHNVKFNGGLKEDISAVAETNTETKYLFKPELFNAVKRTEFKVDKATQEITLIAQQQSEQSNQMAQLQVDINSISTQIQQDIPDLYTKYSSVIQNIDDLTIDIGMKNGTNLIRNSAMKSGYDYWMKEPWMSYITSEYPPADPYDLMWWYCTENKNGYERGVFYRWHETGSYWERTTTTKDFFGGDNLLEHVEYAENDWARQNTISGSQITFNGKNWGEVTHIFALTNPMDMAQTQDYITVSHLIKNNIITGIVYFGVTFSPVYIEDLRTIGDNNVQSIFEDGILITADDMTDLTRIERTVKIPKKEDVMNVIADVTAPVDTSLLWLDTSNGIGVLKYYVDSSWILYPTHPTVLDQNNHLWVYRAFYYGYYETTYGIDDFNPKVAYCFFTFYPAFTLAIQDTEPTPYKGLYWADDSVGGTVKRAKYDGNTFVEWIELGFPTAIILANPLPVPPYPAPYAMPLAGNYYIADLKLEYGRYSSPWTQHPEEMYGKNFKFDTNGFTIRSAQNEMFIDEDEINAKYNGTSIFSIFKDAATFQRTVVNSANIAQIETVNQTINGDSITLEF